MNQTNVLYLLKSFQKELIRCFSKDMDNVIEMNNKATNKSITLTQIQIIEYLIEHEDQEVYQRDLENILNLRRATVSGVLQTMEKNNLIERKEYQQDARVKKIILNNNTKELYFYHQKRIKKLEEAILKDISKKEQEIFSVVLEKMKNNITLYQKNKE